MCKFPTRSQSHSLNHPNSLLLNNRLRKPYNNRRKRMNTTTSDRQPVGTGSLQFDEDTDATQQNPAYDGEHHRHQQILIANQPPPPGAPTPFAKRQADIAETAAQQMPPTITHIPQDAAFQRPRHSNSRCVSPSRRPGHSPIS